MGLFFVKRVGILFFLVCAALSAQTNTGELRLSVTDPAGLGVKATIEISSAASQYHNTLVTDDQGKVTAERLPYGVYLVEVNQPGFAPVSESVDVHSLLPNEQTIQLQLPAVNQSVTVNATNPLVDPDQAGAVNQIGTEQIQNRLSSLPGRSIQDLVNSQPGWLYEGNAVLHPRGSEYQTQFVLDGVPLTDNRSPSFGPEVAPADDVDSMSIYTAGFPAEYGRKMGGVVEVNTLQDAQQGFHGQLVLSGGSFDSGSALAEGQYVWGKNTLGGSVSGGMSGHYLNPVVPQNFTNTGTVGDFALHYAVELTPKDRLSLIVRHELSRFDIPNEQIQQTFCYPPGLTTGPPCQRQAANNIETMGTVSYTHIFSSEVVADFRGMVRNNADNYNSNDLSNPIALFQHNWFNEGYFKGVVAIDHGHHEIKVGVESDNTFLNENFRYLITDPSQFDPGTPINFGFMANRPDLEQSVFVQDLMHFGNWTVSAGLRWDHYQLLLNEQAVDPRFSISRYFPSANFVLHFSYDRVFITPSSENILLSSSAAAAALNPISLQLPVRPSQGNYYEAGMTKAISRVIKLDANYFRRLFDNYADDDQIQNTGISFPIAFRNAIIYGAEGKLELQNWRGLTGFVSYSWEVGNAWFPVTGGLFLGDDAVLPTSGHFPDSQDQRNTVRGRVRYQVKPRFWIAGGIQYDTGLPFDFDGTIDEAIATYGQQVVDRVNFARGRIYPSFQVNASAGVELYSSDRLKVRFQVDGENLTNVLDVIDFGGLFSGNAIGPSRSWAMRLSTTF